MTSDNAISQSSTQTHPSAPGSPVASRTRLAGLAGIGAGAGAGIVLGHLLAIDPNQPQATYLSALSAHQSTGVIGGLTTATGAFLVLPALTGMLGLVRSRGATLATAGAVLAGVGITALGAGTVLMTLVMGGLVGTAPPTAAAVFADANSTAPLLSLMFALAPLFVIGSILLGIALLLARAVPAWAAGLLIVGGVLVPFAGGGGPLAALTHLPLGAALCVIGAKVT